MILRRLFLLVSIAAIVAAGVSVYKYWQAPIQTPYSNNSSNEETNTVVEPAANTNTAPKPVVVERRSLNNDPVITNDVPFTSQAPTGAWSDQRYQQGCEEASLLMAVRWAQNKPIAPGEALREINAMSAWETERFGFFHDTNVDDTFIILKDYFGYSNASVFHNITTADIILELRQGAVVLVPVNGQKLSNPYYTPPGPLRHMMVITGYDETTDTFVTNDPGTRNGEDMKYTNTELNGALRDYPSGHDLPIAGTTKSMIAVYKE